jgi:hypothetical protein
LSFGHLGVLHLARRKKRPIFGRHEKASTCGHDWAHIQHPKTSGRTVSLV